MLESQLLRMLQGINTQQQQQQRVRVSSRSVSSSSRSRQAEGLLDTPRDQWRPTSPQSTALLQHAVQAQQTRRRQETARMEATFRRWDANEGARQQQQQQQDAEVINLLEGELLLLCVLVGGSRRNLGAGTWLSVTALLHTVAVGGVVLNLVLKPPRPHTGCDAVAADRVCVFACWWWLPLPTAHTAPPVQTMTATQQQLQDGSSSSSAGRGAPQAAPAHCRGALGAPQQQQQQQQDTLLSSSC